ncbi:Cofactor of BRCA1 [Cichlidogyrus casuarinus]|uniref:Cofactor of BRCA1 n=1 Tax=Cichlidogyrus casuarinus TaxID=1844966 RepID=A0ABD2QHW4_9PLAT
MEEDKTFVLPVIKKAMEELFNKEDLTVQDVETFQTNYWMQMVPNFSQALKLLDIHGISRHQLLWNINDRLLETIKNRIDSHSGAENKSKKTQKLWQKLAKTGMVYVQHPYIRPLVMQVLGKMTSIKDRHISLILQNSKLYNDSPLPVLRHIWTANPEKYINEISDVIESANTYVVNLFYDGLLAAIAPSLSSSGEIFAALFLSLKKRRKNPTVSKLVNMIGDNEQLYEITVEFLRERHSSHFTPSFTLLPSLSAPTSKKRKIAKNDPKNEPINLDASTAFFASFPSCILRFDLLMSLLEAKMDQLTTKDPIHRIVWCLDACVRSRKIDQRHANELANHLYRQRLKYGESDSKPKSSKSSSSKTPVNNKSKLLEKDLSMVLQDPWVLYTIISAIIRLSLQGLYQDKIPREQEEIHFLVNLLAIGLDDSLSPPSSMEMPQISVHPVTLRELKNPTIPPQSTASMPKNLKEALMRFILPSMCRFQVSLWCHQVSDEIFSTAHKIWAPPSAHQKISMGSPPASGSKRSRNSSSSGRITSPPNSPPLDNFNFNPISSENVPAKWKRKLEEFESSCESKISIQILMFQHPLGMLMLQYHSLFALERRDYITCRTILKAISVYVQEQNRTFGEEPTELSAQESPVKASGKRGRSHSESNHCSHLTFSFNWRPDCLQAIATCLASMPVSANVGATGDSLFASRSESSRRVARDSTKTSTAANPESLIEASVVGCCESLDSISRSEMVHLLKTTLQPISDDFHKLVVLQLSRLLPIQSQTSSTSGHSAGDGLSQLPPLDSSLISPTVSGHVVTEREKLINLIADFVTDKTEESEEASENAKETSLRDVVRAALDFCQKDLKNLQAHQNSLTAALDIKFAGSSEKPAIAEPSLSMASTIVPVSSPESTIMGPPINRYAPPQYSSSSQPSLLEGLYGPNPNTDSGSSSSPFYNYSNVQRKPSYSVSANKEPIDFLATPLTNPGLSTSGAACSMLPPLQAQFSVPYNEQNLNLDTSNTSE